ncbi:MAG TPA: hypothetical protein VIU61_19815 [Kofleriaceae bacterium]
MRFAVAVVLVVACGGGGSRGDAALGEAAVDDAATGDAPADAPDYYDGPEQSGTRLKLRWYDFAGARGRPRIYDAERAETCETARWTSGERCTPYHFVVEDFADPQCTQPVLVSSLPAGLRPPYMAIGTRTCGTTVLERVDRVGTVTGATQIFRRDPGGTCTVRNINQTVYGSAGEVTRAELVPLTRAISPGTTRIGRQFLRSEDGLRIELWAIDRELADECIFEDDRTGAKPSGSRCMPRGAALAQYELDTATCLTPAIQRDPACPLPRHVEHHPLDPARCVIEPTRLHRVGAPIPNAFGGSPGACVAKPPQPNLYGSAGELAIAAASRAPAVGTTRIRPIQHTADGEAFHAGLFHDADLDSDCSARTVAGTVRCMPLSAGGSIATTFYFSNDLCTTQLVLLDVPRGPASCTSPAVSPYTANVAADGSGAIGYQVGARYAGPLFIKSMGTCIPYAPSERDLYPLTVVPLTTFASGTIVTDP